MGCEADGDQIRFWVSDIGKGIDPEFRDKIFERFQARPSGANHRGPGLGLSIVKSFVELHGGAVDIESTLDEGTTVVCRVPVNGPRLALGPTGQDEQQVPPGSRNFPLAQESA